MNNIKKNCKDLKKALRWTYTRSRKSNIKNELNWKTPDMIAYMDSVLKIAFILDIIVSHLCKYQVESNLLELIAMKKTLIQKEL